MQSKQLIFLKQAKLQNRSAWNKTNGLFCKNNRHRCKPYENARRSYFSQIRTKRKSRLVLFFLSKSFLTRLEDETRPVSQISRHVKPTREKDSRVLSGFVFCVFYGFRRCNKTNPNISWSTWKIIQVLMTCRADGFRRNIRWQLTGVDLICPFTWCCQLSNSQQIT